MKKLFAIMLACAMLITCMSACSSHSHTESENWMADAAGHWKTCEGCEEKLQAGDHALNDESRCTVCSADVMAWDDSVSVYTYDEHDNLLQMADYDAEGTLLSEIMYEYEYDSNGNMLKSRETVDGFLTGESEYTVSDGESIITKYTQYNEDGSKFVNEYDSNGNDVALIDYDADGNVNMQTISQYAQTAEGEWYETTRTENYADGTKIEAEYNEQGDNIAWVSYDADGNVESSETWDYTYDDNGNWATMKAYMGGVLFEETVYKTVTAEDSSYTYPETVTTYNEDGSKTVCVYNENDELVSETTYDADGNMVE